MYPVYFVIDIKAGLNIISTDFVKTLLNIRMKRKETPRLSIANKQ